MSEKVSRRDALKIAGALVGGVAIGGVGGYLAGQSQTQAPAQQQTTTVTASNLSMLEPALSAYAWSGEMAPGLPQLFGEQYGVTVTYDESIESNESMEAKVAPGTSGYDVVVPTDHTVVDMIQRGMLQELDLSKIPNYKYLLDEFKSPTYDPSNKYSIPLVTGTTGIGYNTDEVKDDVEKVGWGMIFDPNYAQKYSKKISLLNYDRAVFNIALLYLGYTIQDTDRSHWEEAKNAIIKIKPYLAAFDTNGVTDNLVAGNYVLAETYSGNLHIARMKGMATNPPVNLTYVIPSQGASVWVDNFAILKESKKVNSAHALINNLIDPRGAGLICNFVGERDPNKYALDNGYIMKDIADDPALFPTPEATKRLQINANYTDQDVADMGKLWTEIQAA
ncbi:MAG: spermidine/putrescine ABC transporter substrate-binding protein [Candidatus Bathyarchaeia archaeon]|jgi:spermidine/putrescine-binding protein